MDYVFDDCVSLVLEKATQVEIGESFRRRISVFVEKLTEKKLKNSIIKLIIEKKVNASRQDLWAKLH